MKSSKSLNFVLEKATKLCIPIVGTIELTARCNLNCLHCYLNRPINDMEAKQRELKYGCVCDILDQLADAGCIWLTFTGGEIFLRDDFLDIYQYAHRKGFLVTIATNATFINSKIVDFLKKYPPFLVSISLYGFSKQTYENVTRVAGSYDRCIKGIHLLSQNKIRFELKTTVMVQNYSEVSLLKDFSRKFGCRFTFYCYLSPRFDGTNKNEENRLPPKQIAELEFSDRFYLDKFERKRQKFKENVYSPLNLFNCQAGITSFYVASDGSLRLCASLPYPAYDLLEGSFKDGWGNWVPEIRMRRRQRIGNISTDSEFIFLSLQCPARSYIFHGDLETPVPYLEEIFQERLKRWKEIVNPGER